MQFPAIGRVIIAFIFLQDSLRLQSYHQIGQQQQVTTLKTEKYR